MALRTLLLSSFRTRAPRRGAHAPRAALISKGACRATAAQAAGPDAAWLKLEAGDAVVIDNYRMFHGRAPYSSGDRMLWRQWVWSTDSAHGVPGGPLYSDSRFADEAFLQLGQEELDELAALPLSELRLINQENREGATLGRRNGEAARLAAASNSKL